MEEIDPYLEYIDRLLKSLYSQKDTIEFYDKARFPIDETLSEKF